MGKVRFGCDGRVGLGPTRKENPVRLAVRGAGGPINMWYFFSGRGKMGKDVGCREEA
jgi:hypothetical protein